MPLHVVLPLPPTDNHLYVPVRRGGQSVGLRLSDKAKAYKVVVAGVMSDAALKQPDFDIKDDLEYAITLTVFFETVYNKGWPQTAKNRFRKIDSHNRLKLVVDAVMEGIGLDDNCLFEQSIIKQEDKEEPRVEVEVRRWEWA